MAYDVRTWSLVVVEANGALTKLVCGGAIPQTQHDGAGTIYIAIQAAHREISGNPKMCHILRAGNDGRLYAHMIIKEIYGQPTFYLREDGIAIVQGLDHNATGIKKVTIDGWVPRKDVGNPD